ncbi:MAG: PAS domain S-box protein [Methanoregula sp.]|jgi:PAS domain S-box-containing protein|nr:PAS domain S-box protein [Methanoregula sp.]
MPVLDREKVDRLKQILKWQHRGVTISDLAAKMDMNRNLVAKYLDMLLISGQVEMQVIGAAKVYFLSRRVPIASMLEFSSDMVIVLDNEQRIVQVNKPVIALLDEKKETLIGNHIRESDNPLLRAVPVSKFSKISDTAPEQISEMECILKEKKYYFKVKQLSTAFEDGTQGITLIIEDITTQIEYQRTLELNESRYRGIVEDQTEFITRFLPDGTLVFINDAYARYLEMKEEDLLGGPHIPGIDSEDLAVVNQCIQSLDIQNPVQSFECRIHHPCGKERSNLWTARALFDDTHKPVEYQGIGRDNTEKREAAMKINQYIRDLEFLSQKAQEFVELSRAADIFQIIGQGLSELIPSAVIGVNSYDPHSEILTVRAIFPERDHQVFSACFGQEYIGFQYQLRMVPAPLRALALNEIMRGRLFYTDESLYNFLFQQVPADTCDRMKETLNLGDRYYGIGIVRLGILFGTVTFSLRKGETINNSSLIETYIHQASIILHRRVTEDSLRKSEARYRGIVEDQTEFVTRFLPDWTLTFVNDSVCRYFLKDRNELLGRSLFSLIPQDDQDPLMQNLLSLNARNPVQSVEHHVLDPSGRIRWTQWTNRALFDDNGKIIEYQGVGRDTTEQKEAEAKIRQYIVDIEYLSQKSHEFLELPPDGDIYGTICRGVRAILPKAIVLANSIDLEKESATTQILLGDEERIVFSALLGEDIVGKVVKLPKNELGNIAVKIVTSGKIVRVPGNLFIATQKQSPEDVCAKIEETLNIGDIFIIGLVSRGIILANVVIMLQKGDTLEHVDLIEAYIRQAANALLRQRTAENLKESEKLYRSVIENIQDVFYRSDKEGNLIMASPSWASMLGYDSLDDCIGYNIAEKFYFKPEDRKEFLDAVYQNGSVSDYEVVLKCRDGTPFFVSTNSHLYYDDAGILLGVEGIFRDISERRATAEKLRTNFFQMEFFSRKIQEFMEFPPDSDIFEKIASDLKLLIADAMICVNSFDDKTCILRCRSCKGDNDRATFTRYLGRNPEDIDYPINPIRLQSLSTGQLQKVSFSLYNVLFGVIPSETCDQLIEAVRIGDIYGIGFSRGDILFGNATIFLHKGAAVPDIQFIETYAQAASIALHRRIAEESLKESREIFTSVATYAPVPIAIIEPDGRYQFINQKFVEIFGYDLNDFKTGKEWFSLAYPDPDYRRKVIATWKSDLEASMSGQQRPETFTVRCKNGVDREIFFLPVTLSDNKQCIVYEDITERGAAE